MPRHSTLFRQPRRPRKPRKAGAEIFTQISPQPAVVERHQAQKMEALGRLAGCIAHDVNNVLAAIQGQVLLARTQASPGQLAQHLDEITQATRRAHELVRRILDFSRPQPAPTPRQALGPVVREAVALLRAGVPAGVQVTLHCEADGEVMAGAGQIHQLVMNLGLNAQQALPPQGGRIDLRLQAAPGQAALRLSVTDTGRGMDAATRARIFEPFFTTRADQDGSGLGLCIVRDIVGGLGGRIALHSRPGEGSRFEITLPLAAREGQAARSEGHRLPMAAAALLP